MSAGNGPKVFALQGSELTAMMKANFESLEKVVDDIDKAIAAEKVDLEQAEKARDTPTAETGAAAEKAAEEAAAAVTQKRNMIAHLERWREKFATDAVGTQILLTHVRPKDVHMLTGTEMLGVFRTFRTVHVHIPFLRLNAPPPDGELAEHRLAATAAAVPRAAGNAVGVTRQWTPGTPGAELLAQR